MVENPPQSADHPCDMHPVDASIRVRLIDREEIAVRQERVPPRVMAQIDVHPDEVRDDDVGGLADVLAAILRRVAVVHADGDVEPEIAEELVEFCS